MKRKQYTIAKEIIEILAGLEWYQDIPEDFPFDQTHGKIELGDGMDADLLHKLKKRDLTRFCLARYGKQFPKGECITTVKDFIFQDIKEFINNREVESSTKVPNPWDEWEKNKDQPREETPKPPTTQMGMSAEIVKINNKIDYLIDLMVKPLAAALRVQELRKKVDMISELLTLPLVAAKAIGVELEDQISRLDEIPEDLDLSTEELHKILASFNITKTSWNKGALQKAIQDRQKFLLSVKDASEEYEVSFEVAEKAIHFHKSTNFPMKQVIEFLVHK